MAATDRHVRSLQEKNDKILNDKNTTSVEKFRALCLNRGASGIKGISRQFRIIDDDGNKKLSMDEFKKAVRQLGMDDKDVKELFNAFDTDHSGSIEFDEFLAQLRPPMSKNRENLIKKAFQKLDKTGDGIITVEDLKGVYEYKTHPKFQNGEWSEDDVFRAFIKSFDSPNDPDGQVTWEEFLNYYSGVSASIDEDCYFDLMMRQAWKI
eukprot:Nk52_evm1s366 gene=Nk52_evmTU1s366